MIACLHKHTFRQVKARIEVADPKCGTILLQHLGGEAIAHPPCRVVVGLLERLHRPFRMELPLVSMFGSRDSTNIVEKVGITRSQKWEPDTAVATPGVGSPSRQRVGNTGHY